ncbi:MAG: hypothetical protein AAGI88_20055 [Pseudomonadota bacterium]
MSEITRHEVELIARKESERVRTQAYSVIAVLAAVATILGFLGLDDAVKTQIKNVGAERILEEADIALERAGSARTEAEELLASISAGDPDYDSGWFEAGFNSQYPLEHGIGAIPRRYTVLFSQDKSAQTVHLANQIWFYGSEGGRGVMITHIDDKEMYVRTGSERLFDTNPGHHGTQRINAREGYLRVLCWK